MSNWLMIARAVVLLIPIVYNAIKEVEIIFKELFPGEKKGAEKLEMVKGIIGEVGDVADESWPTIEKIINFFVGWFNDKGIFTTTEVKK